MSARPTSAPARNPQNRPSTSSLQPSHPRTSPSTNASFTSPKPMLRGERRCNAPSVTAATAPPRIARPNSGQASSPTAARARSTTVATASGYTIRFGNRKCSRSMTDSATRPAAIARNAGSAHESWYRMASPTKTATVTPASSAARAGCKSRRHHPISGSRCGTRSTTTSRPSPATTPATAHTATTTAVTCRPKQPPALLRASRRRGPHHLQWRLDARPERERQGALVHEHAETAGGARPARAGFPQPRRFDRIHGVEDELVVMESRGVERRRLAVHPDRRRVDDQIEWLDGQLVEGESAPAGSQRGRASGRVGTAGCDRDVSAGAAERVRDRPGCAAGADDDSASPRDRDPLVTEGAQEAVTIGGVTGEGPVRVHDRVAGAARRRFG